MKRIRGEREAQDTAASNSVIASSVALRKVSLARKIPTRRAGALVIRAGCSGSPFSYANRTALLLLAPVATTLAPGKGTAREATSPAALNTVTKPAGRPPAKGWLGSVMRI